jgi:hypothetical protein
MQKTYLFLFCVILVTFFSFNLVSEENTPTVNELSEEKTPTVKEAMEKHGYVAAKIYMNDLGLYEVEVNFYGNKLARVLLDYETKGILLNKVYCDLLELDYYETGRQYNYYGASDKYWIATVEEIDINGAKLQTFDSKVVDFTNSPYLDMLDVEGVMGKEILLKYHAYIDYYNEYLYLKIQ